MKDGLGRLRRALTAGRISGLALITVFVLLRVWDPVPLETMRGRTFDFYQIVSPRVPSAYPVTIVDIDEASLQELGQWPWSRALVADLVEKLAEGGAAAIGFDVLFAEPDRLSPPRIAKTLDITDPDTRARLEALPDSDAALAAALRQTPTVLGRAGSNATNASGADPGPKTSIATIGGDPKDDLIKLPKLVRNLPELEAAARGLGLFTVQPEPDGIIRRVPTVLSVENQIVPALSIELLRIASGASALVIKRDEAGVRSIVTAGAEIPTDREGQLWLHFGPHDPKRFVSAADVLKGTVDADRIAGKLVLIGTSAVGLFDLRSTPVERVMPGVEIHAQALESIIEGSTLIRPNYALGAEIVLAAAIGIGIVVAVPMLGALPTLTLGAMLAILLGGGAWYLFSVERTLIDVAYPVASSLAVFIVLTFFNYFREERRRAQIRNAFRQYLSPDLVEQVSRNPDLLVLGGETREMTILFSDVRGFSSIAEGYKSNPSGLTKLMNQLLTPLSYAIIEKRGTIDKYIGDAVMAFWNAPVEDPDHASNAGEAALEMLRRLDELNAARLAEVNPAGVPVKALEMGIGISTGASVVGNMGSDIRFDYSVLGDAVNLASRLEGLATQYGVRVLLASETARRCAGKLATVKIDRVRVKGRQEIETIYALLGGRDYAQSQRFKAFSAAFEEMLAHYWAQRWTEARRALDQAAELNDHPDLERLFAIYAQRLAGLEAAPPRADWDGVV